MRNYICYIPWLKIPEKIVIGSLEFRYVEKAEISKLDCSESEFLQVIFDRLRDEHGRPFEGHTIIKETTRDGVLSVAECDLEQVFQSTKILAFACMAEQNFWCGHSSHRINSSCFRAVGQPVIEGSKSLTVTRSARDGGVRSGGYSLLTTTEQRPVHTTSSTCPKPDRGLLRALVEASECDEFERVFSAISIWLMANSEEPYLTSDALLTMSVFAFEKLLIPDEGAIGFATSFEENWSDYCDLTVGDCERVTNIKGIKGGDNHWSLLKRWAYEIYQRRSAFVHHGVRGSINFAWSEKQQEALQAAIFSWAVKILLSRRGLLSFRSSDEFRLRAIQEILALWDLDAEHWDSSRTMADRQCKYGNPSWDNILTSSINEQERHQIIKELLSNTEDQ